jgi:prepilin-type N-terminal cleavage/methylation domain-containing protein
MKTIRGSEGNANLQRYDDLRNELQLMARDKKSQTFPKGPPMSKRSNLFGFPLWAITLPGRRKAIRNGLTLIEMLVAITITLLMMAAVVQIFGMIGESITNTRAMLELDEQLRRAARLLQQDLERLSPSFTPTGWNYENLAEIQIQPNSLSFTARYATFPDGHVESPVRIRWIRDSQDRLIRTVEYGPNTQFREEVLYNVTTFEVKGWLVQNDQPSEVSSFSSSDMLRQWSQWVSEALSTSDTNPPKLADFDGLDNDNDGLVDETDEFSLPAPWALRGIRVTIRVKEPNTEQRREVVVIQDFLPK